jgi:hypothetical protein
MNNSDQNLDFRRHEPGCSAGRISNKKSSKNSCICFKSASSFTTTVFKHKPANSVAEQLHYQHVACRPQASSSLTHTGAIQQQQPLQHQPQQQQQQQNYLMSNQFRRGGSSNSSSNGSSNRRSSSTYASLTNAIGSGINKTKSVFIDRNNNTSSVNGASESIHRPVSSGQFDLDWYYYNLDRATAAVNEYGGNGGAGKKKSSSPNISINCEDIEAFNRLDRENLEVDNDEWLSEKPISVLQLDAADRAVLKIAGNLIFLNKIRVYRKSKQKSRKSKQKKTFFFG